MQKNALIKKARDYFDKAVQASKGEDCSIYVRFAEAVYVKTQNRY